MLVVLGSYLEMLPGSNVSSHSLLFPQQTENYPWLQRPSALPTMTIEDLPQFFPPNSAQQGQNADSSESNNITLRFSDRLGTKTSITCSKSLTIRQLKQLVGEKIGRSAGNLVLKTGNVTLKDWVTILDCQLGSGSNVELGYQ